MSLSHCFWDNPRYDFFVCLQEIDTIIKTLTEAHKNTLFYDEIPAKETAQRHSDYLVSTAY